MQLFQFTHPLYKIECPDLHARVIRKEKLMSHSKESAARTACQVAWLSILHELLYCASQFQSIFSFLTKLNFLFRSLCMQTNK